VKLFSYRYLPLNIYILYTFFVISCLFLQPIYYENLNYLLLLSYIGALLLMFSLGYISGAKGGLLFQPSMAGKTTLEAAQVYFPVRRILRLLILCSLFFVLQQWLEVLSSGVGLDLGKLGENYVKYYEGYERGRAVVNFSYIVNILSQSVLTLCLFLGAFYYKELPKYLRWTFLFVVISYILVNVIVSGKQKFFGDVVIIAMFCLFISMARCRKKIKFKSLVVVGVLSLIVLGVFVEILNQRYSAAGIGIYNISEKAHPLMEWDENSFWFELFGNDYGFAIGVFLWYFTNGIYGLSLSLSLPFEWTYFVGNSYSLARVVEIISGDNIAIIEKTYPVRVGVEYGWDLSKWHSLFSWLASDITFYGVIVLSFFFGFLYGKLWVYTVSYHNPFSGPLFLNLSLGLIFSFSNNQLMHGMAGVVTLAILMCGYFYYSLRKDSQS